MGCASSNRKYTANFEFVLTCLAVKVKFFAMSWWAGELLGYRASAAWQNTFLGPLFSHGNQQNAFYFFCGSHKILISRQFPHSLLQVSMGIRIGFGIGIGIEAIAKNDVIYCGQARQLSLLIHAAFLYILFFTAAHHRIWYDFQQQICWQNVSILCELYLIYHCRLSFVTSSECSIINVPLCRIFSKLNVFRTAGLPLFGFPEHCGASWPGRNNNGNENKKQSRMKLPLSVGQNGTNCLLTTLFLGGKSSSAAFLPNVEGKAENVPGRTCSRWSWDSWLTPCDYLSYYGHQSDSKAHFPEMNTWGVLLRNKNYVLKYLYLNIFI